MLTCAACGARQPRSCVISAACYEHPLPTLHTDERNVSRATETQHSTLSENTKRKKKRGRKSKIDNPANEVGPICCARTRKIVV